MRRSSDTPATTALLPAIETGNLDELRRQLETGADGNARNERGVTYLTRAVTRQNRWVIEALIDAGADVNGACKEPASRVLRLLPPSKRHVRSQPEENPFRRAGWTPVMEATRVRAHHLIELLVDRGADSNAATARGHTALMEAAGQGYATVTQTLLDHGAVINQTNQEGWSALHHAASRGYLDVMQILLGAGADLNLADAKGVTPLMRAVINGHEPTRMLLRQGADLHAVSQDGESAMSFAVREGNASIASLLIENGADRFMQSWRGKRIVEQAKKQGVFSEMFKLVQEYWRA